MSENTLPFSARFSLAFSTFFRLLFNGRYAAVLRSIDERTTLALTAKEQSPETLPSLLTPKPVSVERDVSPALQLLELLQREGRFVDFLQQDIVSFSDADVGAAARLVHQGCRKALERIAVIEAIRPEPEGVRITLDVGFDAKAHRLVGNVQGQPPYLGTLRHRGWRVIKCALEEPLPGAVFTVVAPAEIEL